MIKSFYLILIAILFCNSVSIAQSDSTKTKDSIIINNGSANQMPDTAKYALLYVYRQKNFSGSAVGYNLHVTNSIINDQVIGRIKNNSKFVVKLYQEGKTEFWSETESKRSVSVNVIYGQKYYLKCSVGMGVMVGRPQLDLVYSQQGELDYDNVEGREK